MLSCFGNQKSKTRKERFFLKNGAVMLQKLIHDFNGNCNPIRIYSRKEVIKATNNYHWDRITHEDWKSRLYKGVHENDEILVKVFERGTYLDPLESITNEVAIASNMSKHKNVLKLLGCCLETELPTLVYEFPAKGNLLHHIYGDGHIQSLPWQMKLKIAIEVADAVAYLHYGTSKMIIHRHIKIGHIYLDKDYAAKLSEFRTSVTIPPGKSHVDVEMISGIDGCLAPEYVVSGRTSEKSDVYNFGILLLELISGMRFSNLGLFWDKEICSTASSSSYNELECRKLENLCKTYLEANIITEDESKKQIAECAKLVERCLKTNLEERPIMTEVAKLLRLIKSI